MYLFPRDAACAGADPELFFVPTNDYDAPAARAQVREAKAYCRDCPVRDACLQWALDSGQDYGVWGGATELERRAMKQGPGVPVAV